MSSSIKIARIYVSNPFIKFKKGCNEKLQVFIDDQIQEIVANPEIGEIKKADLKGVRVHKFKYKTQLFLLAYKVIENNLHLYLIGTHENYYKKLKQFLQ